MATAESNPASADSELEHSFGPLGVGFDFLPLALPEVSGDAPLPTRPAPPLPVLGLESKGSLPELGENGRKASAAASTEPPRRPGQIWLDGDVILCACPDCSAPMSVRFWLMLADCWRCGTSIELSEEQERQVQQLLAERERRQVLAPAAVVPIIPPRAPSPPPPATRQAAPPPAPAVERFRGNPAAEPASRGSQERTTATLERTTATPSRAAAGQQAAQRHAAERRTAERRAESQPMLVRREPWLRHLLNETPAWLISMLIHMIALTVLALLTTEKEDVPPPYILLSASYARVRDAGGNTVVMKPDDEAKFDMPLPSKADLSDDRQRKVLVAAAQDARELRLDDDTPNLPDLSTVKAVVGRADGFAQAMAARDPRLRAEIVTREGGTTLTEAAVARGLRWLTNHQNADGSWSLWGFSKAGDCNCSGDGGYRSKAPGTALAMLPYLGAGQTHLAGKYKGTVSRGLRWLLQNQKEDGDLRAGAYGNEGMYTHGQATIVLCEAFAMTGDEALRVPAQKAINFIAQSQYNDGGWRYTPGPRTQRGDTSVVGWQLMALQSARAANLTVPEETWGRAGLYFDSVQHMQRGAALFSYQAGGGPTATMTAEALLCRVYLGWTKDEPGFLEAAKYLAKTHAPNAKSPNLYYWYYGTQVMHHVGGQEWEDWNVKMRDLLVESQADSGHVAGSWYDPRGEHASAGGRIYTTSLAICTLEVYYRHLPIFRQIELSKK